MRRMFSNYPDVVSVSELMQMLSIGKNTAYNLLQSGAVKSIKVGKQYNSYFIKFRLCLAMHLSSRISESRMSAMKS